MVHKNAEAERLRLTLEGWSRLGEAHATYDGRNFLVFGGIPGEEVVAEVIKCRPEYTAAVVVEVLKPSRHRTVAPCPYFGSCTGCQWQHVNYDHQLQVKRQMVLDALGSVGGFDQASVSPTVPSPEQYGYRNHARVTVGRRKGDLGFVNRESRRFVPIDRCLLMHPWINESLQQLQGKCAETTQMSLRYGVNTGDFLVQPALKNQEVALPSGQKHYQESLGGHEFRIAASSFFQVNTSQAAGMVQLVRDGLELSGKELLVDAYAGVGTFAILLAPYARKVIAIEESSSAVRDAKVNAGGMDGIQFIQGKTEDVLAQIRERPHAVILDPPRAGCDRTTLEAVKQLAPLRMVYVSCDPDTLARDLKILCQGPFRLERVQPIDMFPQTHHVECIATLSWAGNDNSSGSSRKQVGRVHNSNLVLASTSPRRRELMAGLRSGFRVVPPAVEEDIRADETPEEMAQRLALAKAWSVAQSLPVGLVVGADSVVVADTGVLGKPADVSEATEMLERLRGTEHQVVTGVAVVDAANGRARTGSQVTSVTMRDYSDLEIESYVASGKPMDKAGAYGVQDKAFGPAAHVDGCYTNVMGLPLCTLVELLEGAGHEFGPDGHVLVPEECSRCPLNGPA